MDSLEIWRDAVMKYSPKAENFSEAVRLNQRLLTEIWETYTQDRSRLGRLPATKPEFVAPYLLGFHLANVARVEGLMERALARGLKVPEDGLRIVDIGCGTGAASHGLLSALGRGRKINNVSIELFDRSRHLLACAKDMLARSPLKPEVLGAAAALEDSPLFPLSRKWAAQDARLTVLCFGFVWNEIGGNRKAAEQIQRTLDFWLKQKSPAWVLICEPATEDGARATMGIRNFFVEDGWHAFYPCPRSVRCPMTVDQRDWCYSEFDFRKTPEVLEVERAMKVSRRQLGGSAYLFLNPAALAANGPGTPAPVVVGHPEDRSGKTRLLVCHGDRLTNEAAPRGEPLPRGTPFKK